MAFLYAQRWMWSRPLSLLCVLIRIYMGIYSWRMNARATVGCKCRQRVLDGIRSRVAKATVLHTYIICSQENQVNFHHSYSLCVGMYLNGPSMNTNDCWHDDKTRQRMSQGKRERDERETNDIIKSIRINSNCFVRRAIILAFWIYYGHSTVVPTANETKIITMAARIAIHRTDNNEYAAPVGMLLLLVTYDLIKKCN